MPRLPTFIVIGAMKAGTTSLAVYLSRHPDIEMSHRKEPNFFAEPGNWDRGVEWYKSLFPGVRPIAGEASTFYTMFPEYHGAAHRIHSLIPEVRLIYLVRDPIERMRSMYMHRAGRGAARGTSLAEAISNYSPYIAFSCYDRQLEPYLQLFGEEQLLVVTTDELRSKPDACLGRVFRHIGADPVVSVPADDVHNRGADKKALSDAGTKIARAAKAWGLRGLTPRPVRRLARRMLARSFGEDALLDPELERMLRERIAPHLVVTRRLVVSTGAFVPVWLEHK